jgi:hypothetical protein
MLVGTVDPSYSGNEHEKELLRAELRGVPSTARGTCLLFPVAKIPLGRKRQKKFEPATNTFPLIVGVEMIEFIVTMTDGVRSAGNWKLATAAPGRRELEADASTVNPVGG